MDFWSNELITHASLHGLLSNGHRDSDAYKEYVTGLTVMMTHRHISSMFVQKMNMAYSKFALSLISEGIPRTMIPSFTVGRHGAAVAVDLTHRTADATNTIVAMPNDLLQDLDIDFSNLSLV